MADIPIYGAVKAMTGEGKAAYASQVYDETLGKFQEEINQVAAQDYAKIDGYYETLGAGTATNLKGQTIVDGEFVYRKSGGTTPPATGAAFLEAIKGNTLAWNQLLPSINTTNYTNPTRINITDGVISYDGSSGNYWSWCLLHSDYRINYSTKNHIFYISCNVLTNTTEAGNFTVGESAANVLGGRVYFNGGTGYKSAIINNNTDYTLQGISLQSDTSHRMTSDDSLSIKDIILIDLTLIYGAGNEPSTPEQFEADYFRWFGKPLTYEPYNAGSLYPVKMSGLKTVGFNQYNHSTGKAKVLGGIEYYISGSYTSLSLNGETITPVNNKFTPSVAGELVVTGGSNATCINISDAQKNGTYEPYKEYSASVPVTTLQGKLNGEGSSVTIFPDGMKRAGSIYDELYVQGGKTYAVKRIGSRAYQNGDETNPSVTTDGLTTTYYALAEPLVYAVEDFVLPLQFMVDANGTEEVVAQEGDVNIAPVISFRYGVNAAGTLESLPQNYISAESMDAFLSALGAQMGGTWTKTWNSATNKYTFTFTPSASLQMIDNDETI